MSDREHWCQLDFGRAGNVVSVAPILERGDRVIVPTAKAWATVESTEPWTDDADQRHTLAVLDVDDMGRCKIRASLCVKVIGQIAQSDDVELWQTWPVSFFAKKENGPSHP